MSATEIDSTPTSRSRSRTIRTLELEHDLIRRFAGLVAGIYGCDRSWQVPARVSQLVVDFAVDFMEGRHHAREERVVHQVLAIGEPRIDAFLGDFEEEREDIRFRLEGMRRALEDESPGSSVSFSWNAQSFANKILRHLDREARLLLPLLESTLTAELDARLAGSLDLDRPESLGHYAQAENILLILKSI